MKLTLWNPWRNEEELRPTLRERDPFEEMMRPFFDDFMLPHFGEHPWRFAAPAADLVEEKDRYLVKVDLPGLDEKDIKVDLQDGLLTISGEYVEEKESEEGTYHHLERRRGAFRRSFNLGEYIDGEKVKAKFKNGTLTVILPKTEESRGRIIKVEGD